MIDASRSPKPLWKRLMTAVVLVAAILLAAWTIWVKELHHNDVHVHALTQAVILVSSGMTASVVTAG